MKQAVVTASGKKLKLMSSRKWRKAFPQDFVKSVLGELPTLSIAALAVRKEAK